MRWRRELLICVALAALTLGVYWPVRDFGLIQYDDPQFITENEHIRTGLSWNGVAYAFSQPLVGNWHPVTTLSHMLDCELWGVSAGAFHVVNVSLHVANSILLFLVLRLLTGSTWRSALVAGVFALHPLRVESVAWIAERKDVLSGLFFLLTLWAYGKWVMTRRESLGKPEGRGPKAGRSPKWKDRSGEYYVAAVIFFAFGLMSKPMVVTVPFVLLLLDVWPLRRLALNAEGLKVRSVMPLLWEKTPFFLLSAADCVITLVVQKNAGAMEVIRHLTLDARVTNAVVSYVRYLEKLFWPAKLSIVYPHPANHFLLNDAWSGWQAGAAALLLVVISIICVRQARNRPYLAVGWFWYLGMMVPVIGLVQVGEQAMADRYTYLPLIGPIVALVWFFGELFSARRVAPPGTAASSTASARAVPFGPMLPTGAAVAAGGIVLGLLVCVSRAQVHYWRDTVDLFQHAVMVTADNPSAHFALATGLEKAGETNRALVEYQVTLAIDPSYVKAHYNLGQLFFHAGNYMVAVREYETALRLNPRDLATRLNLANAPNHLGKFREAVAHFEEALKQDPDSTEALNNLAWLLATSPQPDLRDGPRAVQLAERACTLSDDKHAVMIGTLAAAYAEAGRFDDALAAAEKACAVAGAAGESATVARNRELMRLYRAGKPYRENSAQ